MPSILLIGADNATLNAFLQQHQFQVNTAQSASEAVTKARTTPYDLILFCSPPNQDVMQNIRTAKPNARARILVAGLTEETVNQRAWSGVMALGPLSPGDAMVRAVTTLQDTRGIAVDIDNDFVECVVNAVGKSLMNRFRIRSVLPEESAYIDTQSTPLTDFSALIALCCAAYEGIVALSFPTGTIDKLTRTNADGNRTLNAPEIFNQVAGDLGTALRAHGFPEKEPHAVNLIDTPKVRAAPINCARTLLWTLDCDAGKFYVQFFLAN